jgi:glycerophosphoryl diester phosphodiesterase
MRLLRGEGPLIRVGHRGAASLAPENTLRSFEVALAHGVDAIEFDVLDLARGPLVLAHSNDLAEVSHGAATGTVRDLSLGELREVAPELPTLDEALAFLSARPEVIVHVDLKLRRRLDEVADALRRHGLAARAVGSSFHLETLRALAAPAPELPLGLTYPEDRYGASKRPALQPAIRAGTGALRRALPFRVAAMLARSGARLLMLHHGVVSRAVVRRVHGLGAGVWAWTVDDPLEVERLDAAGVDAVITNDPGVFTDLATLRR